MIRAYLTNLGEGLDRFLNTVLLAGRFDQTISHHAATAQASGRVWGCLLCRWLSLTVERDHCPKTLADEAVSTAAGLKALAQLVLVATALSVAYVFVLRGVWHG